MGHRAGVAGILAATLLLGGPVAAAGQTVEQVVEPYALGAATIIYPDETGLAATDMADLLQWEAPGVEVLRGAGSQLEVVIRGGHRSMVGVGGAVSRADPDSPSDPELRGPPSAPANPLLIVDGYKVSNDDFSWRLLSLSPFEVERVIILRDLASAAIYGIRADRGVILVYTRRR